MSITDKELKKAQKEIMDRAEQLDYANMTPWSVYKLGMKHGIVLATAEATQ